LKLLITGGLGFIGSNLVDSLTKKNHKIKILTKTFSKKDNIKNSRNKVEIEKIDLTNFKRLGYIIEKFKPDVIIHLAGNTSHSKSFEKPLDDIESNSKTNLFMLEKMYWISSGKKIWFYEFANLLEKNTNCKVMYPKTPTYTKKVDVGNFIVNNSKLRKLGWSPKISINAGIRKTLDYFQSN
jgi:nucleoside-diphosphate-sugar epimerase